jgi:8-oxo-dGTP pyrophosphatase MutT (NUDIX family)
VSRRAFSVSVLCRHGGAVLLVRHRRLGAWLPVGGELEPGETPLEAARRELREETGLEGRFPAGLGIDGTPPGLLGYEEHPAGSKGLHLNFCFVADVPSRDLAGCDEFDEVRWVRSPGEAGDAPANVRELVALALAAPPA